MVAMPNRSVLAVLLSDAGGECDPASAEETSSPATSQREVSEELDGERDLGSLDLPDDDYTGDWRGEYGNSVGISSWREL